MGKIYTFDKKLLIGSPQIAIGDKLFSVDDRQKTVRKALKLYNEKSDSADDFEKADEILKLAFGSKFREVEELDLSFAAYLELIDAAIDAMTSGDPEAYQRKKEEKEQSFREQSGGDMVRS